MIKLESLFNDDQVKILDTNEQLMKVRGGVIEKTYPQGSKKADDTYDHASDNKYGNPTDGDFKNLGMIEITVNGGDLVQI